MLVALFSAKGSPGVTTLALAAGAAATGGHLVAECDPAGGDLAARAELSVEARGLVSLAANARRGLGADVIGEHLCSVGPGVVTLLGPGDGARAATALAAAAGPLARAFAALDATVLADCGRWAPGSPATPLLAMADVVVVVLRAEPDQVDHARFAAATLARDAGALALAVVVAGGRWPGDQVSEALGIDVIATVEDDRRAALALARAANPARA
ncbi:MAG: hypothetical protein ACRD0M_09075, partial [Acidimicrobiales bacterium]